MPLLGDLHDVVSRKDYLNGRQVKGVLEKSQVTPSIIKLQELEHEQETAILQLHEGNGKDDTTPWLKFTRWLKLFEDKDLEVKNL
jgi:hypothetical protein